MTPDPTPALGSMKQQRTKALRAAAWRVFRLNPEMSASEVAAAIGSNAKTVKKYRRDYDAGGEA